MLKGLEIALNSTRCWTKCSMAVKSASLSMRPERMNDGESAEWGGSVGKCRMRIYAAVWAGDDPCKR